MLIKSLVKNLLPPHNPPRKIMVNLVYLKTVHLNLRCNQQIIAAISIGLIYDTLVYDSYFIHITLVFSNKLCKLAP